MHQGAVEKIKNIISGALQVCTIKNMWPEPASIAKPIDSLTKEVLKHKGEWLNEMNVFLIFIEHIFDCVIAAHPDDREISGDLKNILTQDQLDSLSSSIGEYFESIPREYDVYLPLPSVNGIGFDSLELGINVSIKTFSRPIDEIGAPRHGFGLIGQQQQLDANKVYLCIRCKGYSGGNIEDSCTRDALSGFKLLLYSGKFRSLFKLEEMSSSVMGLGLGMLRVRDSHEIPKVSLISVDLLHKDSKKIKSELSLDLTRFINKICIDDNAAFIKKAKEAGDDEFKSILLNVFKKSAQLVHQKNEHVYHIKSAIEWSIDSKAEENKTLSFIQNCIGLEAILGEDMGDQPITATLSDRCAYILGNEPKGRRTLREKFKKLYKIRSKLVHGNVSRLGDEANEYHRWGQVILDLLIAKEIKASKLEDMDE